MTGSGRNRHGEPMIGRRGSRSRKWRIGMCLKKESSGWSSCPHCNFHDHEFHAVCPECGRPFIRDYIDWRIHPRDPDLTGTLFHSRSWALFWLCALILCLVLPLHLPF